MVAIGVRSRVVHHYDDLVVGATCQSHPVAQPNSVVRIWCLYSGILMIWGVANESRGERGISLTVRPKVSTADIPNLTCRSQ